MTRAARNRRVFFWEEPIWHAPEEVSDRRGAQQWLQVEQVAPSLWVLRPHLSTGSDVDGAQRTLLAGFLVDHKVDRLLRWYYTPMALGFSSEIDAELTVYDCMDELSGFIGAPPQLRQREQQLFATADVVFTGGLSLYEAKQRQHGNVHAFPSSIDLEHFRQAQFGHLAEPADLASIPHPRVGFYGVLDERLDVALVAEIARLRPETHFVLIGPVVKIDPSTLPSAPNIHLLGAKSYAELPSYLAYWDAAMMPFALNEATRFISPTKTPEYLAAGKAVVSTPIHDVVRSYGAIGLVAIAATPAEFAHALDAALQLQTKAWRRAVELSLAQSSWDSTWAGMQDEIDRALSTRTLVNPRALPVVTTSTRASHAASSNASPLRLPVSLLSSSAHVTSHKHRSEQFDYLVVGAGFAGSVLAERLASQMDKRVLVIDKRDHIAGNAYDLYNEHGILIHQYGPHIFHTNSDEVVAYLSQFTSWRPYEHRVLASVDGKLLPVPINLDTINGLYGLHLDVHGMQDFLAARTVVPASIRTSEDIVVSRVGRELYEKFFRNYTRKQWGLDPSQLDSSVAGRIPVRFDRDDRYFTDSFQAMPRDGYTRMFERMLDHPRITVRTGVSFGDIVRSYPGAEVIFTGPIDEFYDFRFGPLPYRSLEFRHETHDHELHQTAPVINYPNEHAYTRVTEFKQLTGQVHAKTSIVYEYPRSEGDPYYPIPRPENAALLAKYRDLAKRDTSVHFCGRLANYQYFNMDQVVAQALAIFRSMARRQTAVPASSAQLAVSTSKSLRELA